MFTLPLSEQEKRAIEEIVQLVKECKLDEAISKAAATFEDAQGLRMVVREIFGELIRTGLGIEEAQRAMICALKKVEPRQKRQVMEEGLADHLGDIEKLKEGLRKVLGLWADHPDFDEVDVRTWRRELWK